MMTMALAATLFLTLFMMWIVLKPHLCNENYLTFAQTPELQSLSDQKQQCLQVLKDLELDHLTAKLNASEYVAMKNQISLELANILERIDALTNGSKKKK